MPDMDGFKLLEHVGLEMDLPVIMMSVDGETSRVMRGVQHGACDYLLKPIRMKELRNIWQHVVRKRKHEMRDVESLEAIEEIRITRRGLDQSDEAHLLSGGDLSSGKKRRDAENRHDVREFGDPSSAKKARVVWTVELHQKFVKAVDQIGFHKVGPKKILDLMNVPGLTRENVASHLQKYRLYLSRLQKENDVKASCTGTMQSDMPSKDRAGSLGLKSSVNMQQNTAASGSINGVTDNKTLVQNTDPEVLKDHLSGIVPLRNTKVKRALIRDIPDPPKASSSLMGLNHSFGSLEPNLKYPRFDSTIQTQFSWNDIPKNVHIQSEITKYAPFGSSIPARYSWNEVPEIQFKEECKAPDQSENVFNNLSLPGHIQPIPSISPRPFQKGREEGIEKPATLEIKPPSVNYRSQLIGQGVPMGRSPPKGREEGIEKPATTEIKPSSANYRSQLIGQGVPTGSAKDLFLVPPEGHMTNFKTSEPIFSTSSMKNHYDLGQIFKNDLQPPQKGLILGSSSDFASPDEDLLASLLQGECFPTNENKELTSYNRPDLFPETPAYLRDAQRFDYEYPWESIEYPVIDQSLPII
ncbi:hypothetical protein NMG60_11030871 [Bertholletia excelsa]